MKCNLVVPGFAKCGSSSLHEYLNLHPQICMSSEKEPHFFSLQEDYGMRGEEWHDLLFEHADPKAIVFGESSTSYSVLESALYRIKGELDHPKIILILRDPLERLLSHYNWRFSLGRELLSLEDALVAEATSCDETTLRRNGNHRWYRRASNYSYFVPLIQKIFGNENVLLLKTEDLAKSPQEVLSRCFVFLNVDTFEIKQEIRTNVTGDKRVPRFPVLQRYLSRLPMPVKLVLKKIQFELGMGSRKLIAPEPLSSTIASLQNELKHDFEVYNRL